MTHHLGASRQVEPDLEEVEGVRAVLDYAWEHLRVCNALSGSHPLRISSPGNTNAQGPHPNNVTRIRMRQA